METELQSILKLVAADIGIEIADKLYYGLIPKVSFTGKPLEEIVQQRFELPSKFLELIQWPTKPVLSEEQMPLFFENSVIVECLSSLVVEDTKMEMVFRPSLHLTYLPSPEVQKKRFASSETKREKSQMLLMNSFSCELKQDTPNVAVTTLNALRDSCVGIISQVIQSLATVQYCVVRREFAFFRPLQLSGDVMNDVYSRLIQDLRCHVSDTSKKLLEKESEKEKVTGRELEKLIEEVGEEQADAEENGDA